MAPPGEPERLDPREFWTDEFLDNLVKHVASPVYQSGSEAVRRRSLAGLVAQWRQISDYVAFRLSDYCLTGEEKHLKNV